MVSIKLEYDKIYILIYFIYGLSFFTMGILILQNKVEKENNILLLKTMKYLGLFGVTHGITEWVVMVIIANIYDEDRRALFILSVLLNSLSFAFLFYYGIILIEYNGRLKNIFRYIPIIIFALWCIGVLIQLMNPNASDRLYPVFSLYSRYLIGLPGSILAALALLRSIRFLRLLNLDKIANRIKGLAISFLAYGIFAGVFVKRTQYFPSSIINSDVFYEIVGVHVEVARTITAIIITFLSISIIDLFRWVNKQKINRLLNLEIVNNERRRLCQNLHDVIIQNLFATGLKVESLIAKETDSMLNESLSEVKQNLSETIIQIRQYIGKISIQKIDIEVLKNKITDLIAEQNQITEIDIQFYHDITDIVYNYSPSEKLVEVYYIVQEALSNAIKHSKAQKIVITLTVDLQNVHILIFDNGKGFDIKDNSKHRGYGLTSMNERANLLGGVLSMKSSRNGTEILLDVPWRCKEYDE